MKNKIMLVVGLVLIGVGCILGYFTNLLNDIPSLVLSATGTSLITSSIWNKSEKTPLTGVSIGCILLGVFALVFCGVSEKTITTLVTGIIGLIVLIGGILVSVKKSE